MWARKSITSRHLGTAAAAARIKFEGSVRLLPMPHLSPHMNTGKVVKFHAKEGSMIPAYELAVDVIPDRLTEVAEETPVMEIELQEEMYVAKYLCSEGEELKSGAPLAILCEMEEDIEQARQLTVSVIAACYLQIYIIIGINPNCNHNTRPLGRSGG